MGNRPLSETKCIGALIYDDVELLNVMDLGKTLKYSQTRCQGRLKVNKQLKDMLRSLRKSFGADRTANMQVMGMMTHGPEAHILGMVQKHYVAYVRKRFRLRVFWHVGALPQFLESLKVAIRLQLAIGGMITELGIRTVESTDEDQMLPEFPRTPTRLRRSTKSV
jgi:hypothetical protein